MAQAGLEPRSFWQPKGFPTYNPASLGSRSSVNVPHSQLTLIHQGDSIYLMFKSCTEKGWNLGPFIAGLALVAQSCPTLCDPWTVAHQVLLSMEFSRQEYWSGLPCPSPTVLSDPGFKPGSPTLGADPLPSELPGGLHLDKHLLKQQNTGKTLRQMFPAFLTQGLVWQKTIFP